MVHQVVEGGTLGVEAVPIGPKPVGERAHIIVAQVALAWLVETLTIIGLSKFLSCLPK